MLTENGENMNFKALLISLCTLAIGSAAVCAGINVTAEVNGTTQEKLMYSIINCKPYTEAHQTNMFGYNIRSFNKVIGMKGDYCVYRSYTVGLQENARIECRFSKENRQEFAALAKKNPNAKASYRNKDFSYTSDGFSVLMSKFFNDKNVCSDF